MGSAVVPCSHDDNFDRRRGRDEALLQTLRDAARRWFHYKHPEGGRFDNRHFSAVHLAYMERTRGPAGVGPRWRGCLLGAAVIFDKKKDELSPAEAEVAAALSDQSLSRVVIVG